MGSKQSRIVDDIAKFFEATWFDLPMAAAQRLLSTNDDGTLKKAGWKAYDAWINLSNSATNGLYANRTVAEIAGRTIETVLRARQIGDALSGAFFGNLWPAIGLPTAAEMRALRSELMEVRALVEGVSGAKTRRAAAPVNHQERASAADDGLRLIWKGSVPDAHPVRKEGKQHAAA